MTTKRTKKTAPEARTEKAFLRLEPSLVARAKAFRDRLARDMPGMNPSQSDAYRILLHRALEAEGIKAPRR